MIRTDSVANSGIFTCNNQALAALKSWIKYFKLALNIGDFIIYNILLYTFFLGAYPSLKDTNMFWVSSQFYSTKSIFYKVIRSVLNSARYVHKNKQNTLGCNNLEMTLRVKY